MDYLRATLESPERLVLEEAFTLRLGNGVTYRPDAWIIKKTENPFLISLVAYEVKGGHYWAQAKVKNKVAASLYPFIEFFLVRRDGPLAAWSFLKIEP